MSLKLKVTMISLSFVLSRRLRFRCSNVCTPSCLQSPPRPTPVATRRASAESVRVEERMHFSWVRRGFSMNTKLNYWDTCKKNRKKTTIAGCCASTCIFRPISHKKKQQKTTKLFFYFLLRGVIN